jgi:Tat protein translocase TatC
VSGGPSLSFSEHLDELRGRLIICAIALVVCFLVAIPFATNVLNFLVAPIQMLLSEPPGEVLTLNVDPDGVVHIDLPDGLADRTLDPSRVPLVWQVETASGEAYQFTYGRPLESRLYYSGLVDPIYLILKTAVLLGLAVSLPIIFWQAWLFIAPGLTSRERQLIRPMIGMFALLFPIGAAFAYWLMHYAVLVLSGFAWGDLTWLPDISRYVSLTLTLMIAFGIVFELPAVLLLLARAGVVSPAWLAQQRRLAYVIIFASAAILTPPDVVTQLAMGLPLVILYEISIWLTRLAESRRR